MDKNTPSIPWQRVINSQGKISLPAGSHSAAQQRIRLEAEGVEFDRQEKIDLGCYGWDGPDAEWLQENGLMPPYSLRR